MSDDKEKTKATLLGELESIKSLLQTDHSSLNATASNPFINPNCTISEPTLNSPKNPSGLSDSANTRSAPGVLPGQQSLFEIYPETESTEKPIEAATKIHASDASPGQKNPFLADAARSRHKGEQAASSRPPAASEPSLEEAEIERQIDEVIAVYLPRIESELREKLRLKLLGRG